VRVWVFAGLIAAVLTVGGFSAQPVPAQDLASPAPEVSACLSPDQPGRTVQAAPPRVPPGAQNISGTVVVLVTLDEQSHVIGAAIASTTSPLLNDAALEAARASTFQTAIRNCRPVPMTARFIVVFAASTANVVAGSTIAASISSYFLGTWSCESDRLARIVKAFGLTPNHSSLLEFNAYVTSTDTLSMTTQTYSAHGAGISVTDFSPPAPPFTGTSTGWNGDRLEFDGLITSPTGTAAPPAFPTVVSSERMTYVRTDRDHFERTFETAPAKTGPWTQFSHESCARIASPASAPQATASPR